MAAAAAKRARPRCLSSCHGATQHWAEAVWIGKWYLEQKETWMNQVSEVGSDLEASERPSRSGDG